jgi:HEAT repeat protein
VVFLLTELLRDPEWTVRRQAALALGRIGPAALTAVALPAIFPCPLRQAAE